MRDYGGLALSNSHSFKVVSGILGVLWEVVFSLEEFMNREN